MRLLENCIDNSASSEMKGQIEILRQAFSVDVNQPFVLNPSIPFYPIRGASIDPHVARVYTQADAIENTMAASGNVSYATHPLSPPNSIGDVDHCKGDSPAVSLVMLAAGPGTQSIDNQVSWNPTRLFEYASQPSKVLARPLTLSSNWNTSFGVGGEIQTVQAQHPHHSSNHHHRQDDIRGGMSSYSSPLSNTFVSPGMWQDSVAAATVFNESGKRTFPFDGDEDGHQQHVWRASSSIVTPTIRSNGVVPTRSR